MAWLVDTLPPPVQIASKAEKFHHFEGGWEAYRGTGAIGKKVATQVLLWESNSKAFWKGRFKFDGDICTEFVPIVFCRIGEDMWRSCGISWNLPRFLFRSCALSFPFIEERNAMSTTTASRHAAALRRIAKDLKECLGKSCVESEGFRSAIMTYNDYFKVSSNKLKSKCNKYVNALFKHLQVRMELFHSQNSKTINKIKHVNMEMLMPSVFLFFFSSSRTGGPCVDNTCMASNRLENEPLPLVSARPLDLDQLGLLSDDQRLINQNWTAIQIVY